VARDVVALVAGEDVVSAVAVYADRVHDLLRRNGVAEEQTLAVAEGIVAELVAAVDATPETVGDLAGWWFGRCLAAIGTEPFAVSTAPAAQGDSRSMLAGTPVEESVRAAVTGLPRHERVAVMLRDAYDLPLEAVAVALGRSPGGTAELVANARLRLVQAFTERPAADPAGHAGRQPLDLAALAAAADGTARGPTALAVRRHLSACSVCDDLADRMSRARRLALGLPVLAMTDADREALIGWTRARASAVLPGSDEVLAAAAADTSPRGVPVLLVAVALLVAGVLGVGIAVVSRHGDAAASAAPATPASLPPLPSPPVASTAAPPTTATSQSRPPRTTTNLPPIIVRTSQPATSLTTSPASPSASTTSPSPSTSTSAPPPVAAIGLDPRSGGAGTTVTVTGAGFVAHATVTITYGASSSTSTTADAHGRFSATVTAAGPAPGRYEVDASDGINSATAEFHQTG
jgi:DNA-directed RNA polymerase specialized sigma24 family protein